MDNNQNQFTIPDAWEQNALSELSSYQEKFVLGGADFGRHPLITGTPNSFDFSNEQRKCITDIYKYAVYFGVDVADELSEFQLSNVPISWGEVPRLMVDCGLPVKQFNYELALFINGLKDTAAIRHIFSNQFCNSFIKASGIKLKSDQRVPTFKDPLDPGVLIYHNLMTNYKEVRSMPLSILSQMFIEDHKEYEVLEHVLHDLEPIRYNVIGSELNDIQKTKVISYVLENWYKNTIKKHETPAAIEYHENGYKDYAEEFKWEILDLSKVDNNMKLKTYGTR